MSDQTFLARGPRIAVTGVGLVTPLGVDCETTWRKLLAAQRAIEWIEFTPPYRNFHTLKPRPFGGRVPGDRGDPQRLVRFALHAASEAVEQSGLSAEQLQSAGCVIGTSKPDLGEIDRTLGRSRAPVGRNEAFVSLFPSNAAMHVTAKFGCEGASLCPIAACATGLVSLIQAADLIRSGVCPIVIAGSSDASLHPGLLASYRRLGVLAKPGTDPASACRPFSVTRNGFAVGEGAGVLILEDWEFARARQATILAEWIDGTLGSDPAGLTLMDPHGSSLAHVINILLQRNGLVPDDVDCMSLHGTATELNDLVETAALSRALGETSAHIPAFGVKGALGHLMGAAGAVEAALCVKTLISQTVPPTANLIEPDPQCRLNLSKASRAAQIRNVLKVSLGFGGTVSAALLRQAVASPAVS